MSALGSLAVILYFASGVALGAIYFSLLWQTVRLHAAQSSAVRIVPLYAVRIVGAAAVFWVLAQQGAFPPLLVLLGFLIARAGIWYWIGQE